MDTHDNAYGSYVNLKGFTGWVLLSQVFGLAAVILVAVWMGNFSGGFAWQSNPTLEFNYHPLFMIIGMVYLYGDSILIYRVFRNQRKLTTKILHSLLHILALIFAAVGLKAVFDSHNLASPPNPNMYSLHSWLGIITVVLFGMQWIVGLLTFLFPGLSVKIKTAYKPVHVFWGLAIFVMGLASALTGITEKALFSNTEYSEKNPEGILINCLGLMLVGLGLTVGYIVTTPDYARQTLPEEEHLQLKD